MPEVAESKTDANGFSSSILRPINLSHAELHRKKPSATPLHSIFLGYHFQHLLEPTVVDSKPS